VLFLRFLIAKYQGLRLSYIILILAISACSSESTSWNSRAFHNTTAHYNGYYYAREEVNKIEQTILTSRKDNYNRILQLYPRLDSALAKSYDKEVQEAVKMASLAIQRHPNSKWVDDSYILVGRARLYSLDWGNAIQTFKYVNTKAKDDNARHLAIIYLARTFVEHYEFNNAEAAFGFLDKEKLNKENKKKLYLEKAHYYQVREDYDNMVRNLTDAVPLLKKKDKPGRVYFILGQVYQELGFEAEAFNYYRKCIATNPAYETDFYARLYMAQVAEISKSRDIASARKSFKKLLKDSKNREFRDKIYYEMGVFERKQNNLKEAIENYNKALRVGTNSQINGEAYLMLGEIYYDTLRKFELSKAYYDSAVTALPPDYENYMAIKTRQQILSDFVANLTTIQWQDSLLTLSKLDTAALRKHIAAVIESQKEPEIKSKKKKKNRIAISAVNTSLDQPAELGSSNWYFDNPSALSIGQAEFTRIWGSILLEDNWRRSSRTTSRESDQALASNNPSANKEKTETKAEVAKDPVQEEFQRVYPQIPYSDEQKTAALTKIEDAYFKLGDIYNFNLLERENAIHAYETLLKRFPNTEYKPEVYYKLYLIYKDSNPDQSQRYATLLTQNFPNSTFAKILINPNYLQESGQVVNKQRTLYKNAYKKFEERDYVEARLIINEALALEKTAFTANLELLKALIIGRTEDISQYQYTLDQFIQNFPDSEITPYAKKLLESSRQFQVNLEKARGINFSKSLEEPHYFVMVHSTHQKLDDKAITAITKFNKENFNDLQLKVSNLLLNDTYTLTLVSLIPRISTAIEYYRSFNEKRGNLAGFNNHKFDIFVITKDNFDIFYRTKGLDEYLRFFEKNYHPETP
jgi:tetratricopeptide (TPR) repeat protein